MEIRWDLAAGVRATRTNSETNRWTVMRVEGNTEISRVQDGATQLVERGARRNCKTKGRMELGVCVIRADRVVYAMWGCLGNWRIGREMPEA